MKTGLYPNIIVSIENKDIDETNRFIKLLNISLAFKNSVRKISSYFISSKRVTLLIADKPIVQKSYYLVFANDSKTHGH